MAKIEDVLEKYSEEIKKNVIKVIRPKEMPSLKSDRALVMQLVKFENGELLFQTDNKPFRVKTNDDRRFKTDINPDGEEKFNYIFWLTSKDVHKEDIDIHYLKTGRMETHTDLDIAYGDDILFYVVNANKSKRGDDISRLLYSWFAFNAGSSSYLFIETFPNATRNFRLHGLYSHVDVTIEDGKWIIHKIVKKPFPSKYSDFLSYNPIRYNSLQFVQESEAKEAFETINLRDKTTGDTILALWDKYSKIEEKRARDFQERLGKIHFTSACQRKEGITTIQLDLDDEQLAIVKEELDQFINSSFIIESSGGRINIKSVDTKSKIATILDDEYPIKQDASGFLEVDLTGNETVSKRRKRALSAFKSSATLNLINLRFAIEGNASAMLPKPRNFKPLTDKTREFIKKQFGIDGLTKDQQEAVSIAINTPDIAVIQGPPGTGKSTVVAVICQRLKELANNDDNVKKEKSEDYENKSLNKLFLVSAFQNDTVEHIASKIYTNGLPTLKAGKEVQGIKAEDAFILKMKNAVDHAIHTLAPSKSVYRISKRLIDTKALLEVEGNEDEIKTLISEIIKATEFSEAILDEWKQICRDFKIETDDKDKLITAVKGIRTDVASYSDDGFDKVRRLLRTNLPFTQEEKELLENAPFEDEITDDYLVELKKIQDKYLDALLAGENEVKGGVNESLISWLDSAIMEAKSMEERAYDDPDTFMVATLESLREDLFGNTQYIKESIQHYALSMAATNQIAGSKDVGDYEYDNVILEEAARSNPLDLLIPMVKATERIIMVGDQFQLPHLLENDIVDEAVEDDYELKKKYEESLFGIIFNNLENAKPIRRITLTNQFRMHPVIGNFISNTYYDGKIKSDLVKPSTKLHNLQLPWAKDKVVVFCNVSKQKGLERRSGKSKERLAEAERIVELLNELQRDPAYETLNIGVISFYSKQVELISEVARKYGYTELNSDGTYSISPQYQMTNDGREKLRIGSVDSFQGKEFDIVILSTVRSNDIKRIDENSSRIFGFLTLANRLNVAFSRAQKLIITVGDREMFEDELAEVYVKGLYEFNKLTHGEYGSRI